MFLTLCMIALTYVGVSHDVCLIIKLLQARLTAITLFNWEIKKKVQLQSHEIQICSKQIPKTVEIAIKT
jgi:hypothetical protein